MAVQHACLHIEHLLRPGLARRRLRIIKFFLVTTSLDCLILVKQQQNVRSLLEADLSSHGTCSVTHTFPPNHTLTHAPRVALFYQITHSHTKGGSFLPNHTLTHAPRVALFYQITHSHTKGGSFLPNHTFTHQRRGCSGIYSTECRRHEVNKLMSQPSLRSATYLYYDPI